MIRIDYIQEFVKLADCLNFSRASEDLFITQPSLSRHISLLESELGVKLVDRNTRNVRLTAAGEALNGDFHALLSNYQSLMDHARTLSDGFSGRIRLGVPKNWVAAYTEPIILGFSELYPQIKIDLMVCDPFEAPAMLIDNRADLAIGCRSEVGKGKLNCKKIAEDQLCAVMSADHPCAGRSAVSLHDLEGERFILLNPSRAASQAGSVVQKLLNSCNVAPSEYCYVNSPDSIGITIRQGGGVCILMSSAGNLARDYLVSVPLSDPGCTVALYLFCPKGIQGAAGILFDAVPEVE